MKKFLLAVAVLCVGTMALAGPNQGGVLLAHDASLLMANTDGTVSICGQGVVPAGWADADAELDGATATPSVFKVYAAFANAPRLMGVTWGVNYDDSNIVLQYFGLCGDFELNDIGWPGSGLGSTVTWNSMQTALLVPMYWFGAYTYGEPGTLALGPNPGQGGYFGDDSVPAVLDAIHGYGVLGFDAPGNVVPPIGGEVFAACCDPATGLCTITTEQGCLPPMIWHFDWPNCDPNPCPPPVIHGACCDPDTGNCTLTEQSACPFNWNPQWTSCDPNPCPPPVPAENSTWGQIKHTYR